MTTHRTHQPAQEGHSQFAKRGQSSEERMPEDNSSEKFGPDETAPEGDEVRSLAEREGKQPQDGKDYGSGGSYGYGGGFEHGGEKGYDQAPATHAAGEQEEFYESTGGFGHDTEGYRRSGLGHPGREAKRPAAKTADGAPASGHPAAERASEPHEQQQTDAGKGFSQDSGYAQSGGSPSPGGKKKN
jgi:hypothetical protein